MTLPGWYAHPLAPMPGWYADPTGANQLRWWGGYGWTDHTAPYPAAPAPALDTVMAQLKAEDPRPWGTRPVLGPLVAYLVVILAASAIAIVAPSGGTGLTVFAVGINVAIYAAIVGAVIVAGRPVAVRYGGWGRTFGWRRPRRSDLLPALAGIGITFLLRAAVGIIVVAIAGSDATRQAQNLHVNRVNAVTVVLLLVLTVIMAPLVEETVFRGLLLRTFMRRMSFWPAAVLSTTIFALGHTYEVSTFVGAVLLALSVAALGIVNCALVRRTGSLVPGMIVHAAFNLLATIVLLNSVS